MSESATTTRDLWFLDTLVRIPVSHEESADGLSVVDNTAARGDSPPLHVHSGEDEVFHVIEGELRLRIDQEERVVSAGETVLAPRGVPHTYLVTSDRARWLAVTRHGQFEGFVRALARPADASRLPERSGPPSPDQQAALEAMAREHGIQLVGPPLR